ncbi:MAG: ABC transporter ATP-binding protein [Cyclobacteriaceae bacterium]
MIHLKNVAFGYQGQPHLFKDLNLKLRSGSITGLLGKNGAGKTSLLKLIAGLLFPISGELDVLAHEPRKRQPSFLSKVFFVPEEFHLSSISIARFVKANGPFYPDFDHALMERLLTEFELAGQQVIDKLSYGQKKKVLISFSLATRCRLMILDEPTNGLDIPSKTIFRKIVAGALDEHQLVLISTHQVKDVETLIDRIIILDEGNVIMEKDMLEISAQLQFKNSHVLDEDHVLYSEMVPGGYKVITPQRNGDSSVDIELLFNAVTKGNKIFSHASK